MTTLSFAIAAAAAITALWQFLCSRRNAKAAEQAAEKQVKAEAQIKLKAEELKTQKEVIESLRDSVNAKALMIQGRDDKIRAQERQIKEAETDLNNRDNRVSELVSANVISDVKN